MCAVTPESIQSDLLLQVSRVMDNFKRWDDDIDKYLYITELQDRNEKLFYRVLTDNMEQILPIIYTPTVGRACRMSFFRKARSLFVTINDLGYVRHVVANWPEPRVNVVLVTDGERVVGQGDMGSFATEVPVGKLSVCVAIGGIHPHRCLPVVIDVGTDNNELIHDPTYIGLKNKRMRGEKYNMLMEEFIKAIIERYGRDTLIQFEDFAATNAFKLLEKYRRKYLVFNDNIQGVGTIVLAGILSASKITGTDLCQQRYLIYGSGMAAVGSAQLLLDQLMWQNGLDTVEAAAKIYLCTRQGLVTEGSTGGRPELEMFAKPGPSPANLAKVCAAVRPSVVVGATAEAGAFTEAFLSTMAEHCPRPVVFTLSDSGLVECTAEQAYRHTGGRALYASATPFSHVTLDGTTYWPSQASSALLFPGLAMGAVLSAARTIDDSMLLYAAHALSDQVTNEQLSEGRIFPPIRDGRHVATKIAAEVIAHAHRTGVASAYPEPRDIEGWVRGQQYTTHYQRYVPATYPWPQQTGQ